jgi:hypothetical protein
MLTFGRWLILIGAVLLVTGGVFVLLGRLGVSWDHLPGNIRIQTENMTCVFALGASIFLSILLTVIVNLAARFLNR